MSAEGSASGSTVFAVTPQQAQWLLYSDSRLPDELVLQIVLKLSRDPKNVEKIYEANEGWDDRFSDAQWDRQLEIVDEWFFFNREGGPSSRSKIYQETVALIQMHLADYL